LAHSYVSAAVSAAIAFVAVSADEFLILVGLFARAAIPSNNVTALDVALGYALGTVCVLALSSIGFAGTLAPARYVKLIGLVPVALGARKLWRRCLKARARAAKAAAAAASAPSESLLGGDMDAAEPADTVEASPAATPAAAPADARPPSCVARVLCACARPGVAEAAALTVAGGVEEVSLYAPLLAAESSKPASAAAALVRLPPVARAIERVGDAAEPWLLIVVGLFCLIGSVLIPVDVF